MISIIIVILKIVVLLGFLIFIHELGHFTVAKLCNVKVNEFALGFGPVLFSKQGKETKYQLRLIPLGGFVSMEGETEHSEEERAFNKVSIPKRIAIVSAGGLVNIIFATILFFGIQMYKADNYTTEVENVSSGYAAEQIGIIPGDEIIKINGSRVRRPEDINELIDENKDNEASIVIKRNNETIEYKIKPSMYKYKTTGAYFSSDEDTRITGFNKKSSIKDQGFQAGDRIVTVEGINVEDNLEKMLEVMEENKDKESINIEIRRSNEIISVDTKLIEKEKYLLGVEFKKADKSLLNNMYYATIKTLEFDGSIVENLKMLIRGEAGTEDMMGIVGVSKVVAKSNGFQEFLYLMAIISLSLGYTNLLPFPPLDGGKNVLLIIELIRRKPLPEKFEVTIQMVGFALIILLSLFVTYNDIFRVV